MFSNLIDFEDKTEDEIIEFLYGIFKEHFINNNTFLADKIYIDPKIDDKERGMDKPKIYWHIISKVNQRSKKREFDSKRACRIHWIKPIILNNQNPKIKLFYHLEKNEKIRLYLWADNVDFIVILQKLGRASSYLVTSFYIDRDYNKNIYEKRYENYINKKDLNLKDCEWF
jgi:hypothetical protein